MSHRWWFVLFFVVAGCGDDAPPDPGPTDRPVFRWEPSLADDEQRVLVPYGSEATFTLHVTTADGAPYPADTFRWVGSIDANAADRWRVEHVADGVERVTFVPTRDAWESLIGQVIVEIDGTTHVYESPTLRAEAYGGPPLAIGVLQRDVRIRVGEQRPVAALPVANRFPDKQINITNVWPSDTPLTTMIADPAIASVDARGVVTGVAIGTTEIVFTAGTRTERIPLVVEAGALGLPSTGLYPPTGENPSPTFYAFRTTTASAVSTVTRDAQGNPLAIVEPVIEADTYRGALHHVATLARWTGSGMGVEIVSRPFENATGARVVVDSTGHEYVAYDDLRYQRIIVADRPSSSSPWRYRTVTNAIAAAEAAGQETHGTILTATWRGVTMIPRAGGGVWLAWRFAHLFGPEAFEGKRAQCAQFVRLATLGATDGPEHQLVLEHWEAPEVTSTFDCERTIDDTVAVELLPPPAGEITPTVVIGDAPMHIANGAWTLRTDLVEVVNGDTRYLGDVGIDGGPETLRSSGLSLAAEFPCLTKVTAAFATRLGDGVVSSGTEQLMWLRPNRIPRCFGVSWKRTADEVTPPDQWIGIVGDARRLFLPMIRGQGSLALGVLDLGEEPTAQPVTQDDKLPTDAMGPFVRADGTAFMLTSASPYDGFGGSVRPGGVYRALPGAGWTRVGDRGGPAQNNTSLLFERGTELFGLAAGPMTLLQRSPDNGITWLQHQVIALPEQAPYPSPLRGVTATVLPGGDTAFVFIDRQYPEFWRIENLTTSPVATLLSTDGTPWLTALSGGRWLVDGTDVVFLQLDRLLRWRHDGTFVSNTPISMPINQVATFWEPEHGVLALNGQPLGIHLNRISGTNLRFTLRTATMGALAGAERSDLQLGTDSLWGVHAPHLQRLPDGRLLLTSSRITSPGHVHAVYRISSDDGFTWSPELSVDRGAGPQQFVLGAVPAPGGLRFVVGSTIDTTLRSHEYVGHTDYRSIIHALP